MFLAIQPPQESTKRKKKNAEKGEKRMENSFIQLHLPLMPLILRKTPTLYELLIMVSSHHITHTI